jgi:hypothetical protein
VVDDHKHMVVVLNLDVATTGRRSEWRLLLEHLREVHVHLGVVFDHAAEFFDHGMKGSFLLLGRLNSLFQPLVEVFRIGRQPASQTSRVPQVLMVVLRVIHTVLSTNEVERFPSW